MPHRWCNSANLRRQQIESGLDLTFNEVLKPAFTKFITGLNPKSILEVGAGTGHLSKELSQYNFEITAIEPSSGMYKVAADVLSGTNVNLINRTLFDLPLTKKYDLVFSNLVAHIVDNLDSFLLSIAIHLDSSGYLLFSIPHPCFYNEYKQFFGCDYNYMRSVSKNVTFNITKDPDNNISDVPYNHRPLSTYINCIAQSGFSLGYFEEIYPDEEIQRKYGTPWKSPRYCIFMCKKL